MFTVRAPGRVNLIGEHTDYNQGYVLPVAIGLGVEMDVTPTPDLRVEVHSSDSSETETFELAAPDPRRGRWIDYVAGVAWALGAAGERLSGMRATLRADLPMQAGLASSAALELASALALLGASGSRDRLDAGLPEERLRLARLCQRAENEYVGVACGLMDQFASACGIAGHALLFDCRSLEWRPVPLPKDLQLVVVDTGARRQLDASEFNQRRAACERGAALLAERGEPVTSLRDATPAMLEAARDTLGPVIYNRCRHVVEENVRVLEAVTALEEGDLQALGDLFAASHASLRDLFEVSSAELDTAVEIATQTPGVVAARMTGAGFGGCTVNLVERGAVDSLRLAFAADYERRTGLSARVLEVNAVDGAGYVTTATSAAG